MYLDSQVAAEGEDLTLRRKLFCSLEAAMEKALSPQDLDCEHGTETNNWSDDLRGLDVESWISRSEK